MREPGANDELLSLIIVSTVTQRSIDLKNNRDICTCTDDWLADTNECGIVLYTEATHTHHDERWAIKKLISFCVKPRINSSMKSNFQADSDICVPIS